MILLDTHVWIWWIAQPALLSKKARLMIDQSEKIFISAISCWELAMLVEKERMKLDRDLLDWMNQALALPRLETVPLSPEIAVRSSKLGNDFHGDPADRLIVASAIEKNASLITKDRRILSCDAINAVW